MTNAKSTKKICKLCIKYSVKNLIFSSSAAVYGNRSGAISENSKKKPISPYGLSKLNAEKEIKNICKNKINYAILRFFNVAGADYKNNLGLIKNNGSIFKNFSKSFLNKNNKIKIYGNNYKNSFDGTAIRDYINVLDISAIVLKSLTLLKKNKKSFILNCGSGTKTSILELVNTFKKISNTNCELNYLDKRKGDIEISIAKIYKLKKILKFDPIKSKSKLTQLVKASLAWEKKY